MQEFLIYSFVIIFIFISAYLIKKEQKTSKYWKYAWIGMGAYILIEGFRYNVGIDWLHYKDTYDLIANDGSWHQQDWIFIITGLLFGKFLNLECWTLFCILAFTFIYPIYFYSRKNLDIAFYFIILYTFANFNDAEVISRQFSAISLSIVGIHYLEKKKNILFCLFFLLSSLFHSSALIFIPIYFLLYRKYIMFRCRNIYLVLFFLSLFIKDFGSILPKLNMLLIEVSQYIGKDQYANNSSNILYGNQFVLGEMNTIYRIFLALITIIVIIRGDKLLVKYKSLKFYFLYHLSTISLIIYPLFYQQELIKRMILFPLVLHTILLGYIYKEEFSHRAKYNDLIIFILIAYPFYLAYTIISSGLQNHYQFYM